MRFEPNNMWLHVAIAEAEELREQVAKERLSNTFVVLAYVREHQPCSTAEINAATGVALVNVGAIIGTGVRAKRLRFTMEKVTGERRKVKFYSEVV